MIHRTQLYLEETQYEYIKVLASSLKKSIAEIIREWIDQHIEKQTDKKITTNPFWKTVGMISSGKNDSARKFDEYLYGKKHEKKRRNSTRF